MTLASVMREREAPGQTSRVMMKDGTSFEVRRFEIVDGAVTLEGLNGQVWSIRSELVDVEATREANTKSFDYEDAIARARAEYEDAIRSIAREQARLEQRVKDLETALEETRRANVASPTGSRSAVRDQGTEPLAGPADRQTVEPLIEELAKAKVEYEATLMRARLEYEEAARSAAREQQQLEQRINELEFARIAQEDATRQIIRDATSTLGSQINQFVALGGTFEMATGRLKGPSGSSETVLEVATAEADFEVQANDWTLGSLILEYVGDRFDVDTAFLTIGDPQRFPPLGTVGRMIVPFGISTGDPVADVLTLEDPLTIEAFEMRETAVLIGAGFPTPPLTPNTPPVAPPSVRPRALNPFFRSISRGLGYNPPPTPPQAPAPVTPPPAPPLLSVGFLIFQGTTSAATDGRFNYGATAGFVKKWDCRRPYDEGWNPLSCPFSIDVDVDYNSSIFDSRFLELEYRDVLAQIGLVPGMASSVKATIGALSFVGEWNGALERAAFVDDSGARITMRPSAWQVSFGYQFDWNPWVDAIGTQGSYLAFSYSRSEDLGGFRQDGERIGFLPARRFSVSAGEWVMDGLRLAVDFSRNVDYPPTEGGSGRTADGVLAAVTYAW